MGTVFRAMLGKRPDSNLIRYKASNWQHSCRSQVMQGQCGDTAGMRQGGGPRVEGSSPACGYSYQLCLSRRWLCTRYPCRGAWWTLSGRWCARRRRMGQGGLQISICIVPSVPSVKFSGRRQVAQVVQSPGFRRRSVKHPQASLGAYPADSDVEAFSVQMRRPRSPGHAEHQLVTSFAL